MQSKVMALIASGGRQLSKPKPGKEAGVDMEGIETIWTTPIARGQNNRLVAQDGKSKVPKGPATNNATRKMPFAA